jgi:hypothetical protein
MVTIYARYGNFGGISVANLHVPDYLILPFGRAVKKDLQQIALSAVSADGLYFTTDVPVIFIKKSNRRPLCLGDFEKYFGDFPGALFQSDDETLLDHVFSTLKSNNPNMTQSEERFLDYYYSILLTITKSSADGYTAVREIRERDNIPWVDHYKSPSDLWRALLPIPELQLYVTDPLASSKSYLPDNNFRVDYGFWNGQTLVAVEVDGAEPEGYARDIRRDRLLRRAGVDVVHITNLEIAKHKANALVQLLPRQFFGYDWDYAGERPVIIPF